MAQPIVDTPPHASPASTAVAARPLPGPSPLLAAVHGLQFIANPFAFLASIAQRYGDIAGFRMGPVRYCLLNRPDYIKEVLVARNSEFTKGSVLQHTFRWIMGNGLLSSEGDFHLRQRRLCQPAFEPQRIARYGPTMVNAAEATQSTWREGERVNAYETMNQLALTIASQTLFGCEMGNRLEEFHRAYSDVQRGFSLFQVATSVLMYKLGLKSHFSQRRSREAREKLDGIVYGFIDEKQRAHAAGDDLISALIRATDTEGDGLGMDRQQIRDEAMTFLIAGHDTIATTLTWSWYLLAENPECETRLHAELDAVLGDRLPTLDDLPRMPYTQRVFLETMRLYPAIWTIGRTAIRDVILDGYRIPAGCNVMVSPYLTQRDPRYFPDPERFDPDRWREDASPPADLSYFPFGGGKRRCIGRGFALSEGPLVLATLARQWRMRRVDSAPMDVRRAVVLSPRTPLMMRLERRQATRPQRLEEGPLTLTLSPADGGEGTGQGGSQPFVSATPKAPSAGPTHQVLHRGERTMLLMDATLRRMGYSGFGLQFHVWFSGHCDVAGLRHTIERLSRKYPVTTARLDCSVASRPVWRFRPGAVCELRETRLDGPGDAALLDHAARELATPRALDETDPIGFELVHLADGRDVLIVHYNHVLMDSNAIVLMLHELNRLHDSPSADDGGPVAENDDFRRQYVAKFSLGTRWRAAAYTAFGRLQLMRKTPVMLSSELTPPGQVLPPRLIVRTLDRETTVAIVARVRRVTGFRGVSLALLVSLFRALQRVAPQPITKGSVFLASAGMNLREPGATHPIFRIVSSMLRFGVTVEELADRDACLKRLNQIMRRDLANHADVGFVQLTSLVRHSAASGRKFMEAVMRRQQSLTYGYFGSLTLERAGLCGNSIERMYHVVQNWSPPGLAVVANESFGRLMFSVSYTPATISDELAERFLDEFVRDLTAS